MAKPRKDQDIDETKRIMERLVNTPHKPHKENEPAKKDGLKDSKRKSKD